MNTNPTGTDTVVTIKILGPGCGNCRRLEAHAREAVQRLGFDAEVEKVEDINEIMAYGVMRTPGLVVNGRVLVFGRVPSVPEIVTMLAEKI
jgi:small redox-active disulfide protein 2